MAEIVMTLQSEDKEYRLRLESSILREHYREPILLSDLAKHVHLNEQYVRFHGIFSNDMQIYHEDEEGNAYYNFHMEGESYGKTI